MLTAVLSMLLAAPAWTAPSPEEISCRDDMRRFSTSSSAAIGRFLDGFCRDRGRDLKTPEERRCVAQYAGQDSGFRESRFISMLCGGKARECAVDLIKRGKFRKEAEDLREVSVACNVMGTEIDLPFRNCLLEAFPAGGAKIPRGLGKVGRAVCHPERRDRRQCLFGIWRELQERGIQGIHLSTPALLDEFHAACATLTDKGKDCIVGRLGKGFSLPVSRTICLFADREMRGCLDDFLLGEAPFEEQALRGPRRGSLRLFEEGPPIGDFKDRPYENSSAYRVCVLPEGDARRCVLNDLRKDVSEDGEQAPELRAVKKLSRQLSWDNCLRGLPGVQACHRFFDDNFELIEGINALTDVWELRIDRERVCMIPVDQVRECVVSGLPDMLQRKYADLDALIGACQARSLRHLVDIPGATSVPCPE